MPELTIRHRIPGGRVVALSARTMSLIEALQKQLADIATVTNSGDVMQASGILGASAKIRRTVEKQRKEITRPFYAVIKDTKSAVDDVILPLLQQEHRVARLVAEAQKQLEKERIEAQREAQAAADVVGCKATAVEAEIVPYKVKSSVHTRKTDRVEIYNRDAVPIAIGGVELRPPNETALRRVLKAGVEVPGCRLVSSESVVVRGQ